MVAHEEAAGSAETDASAPRPSLVALFKNGAIGANVPALGLVSLFTDVSSEMVAAILPLWLVRELQFSSEQLGTVDAVWRGAGGVLGAIVAFGSDRRRRHKLAALAGYGLSTVSRLLLMFLPFAWTSVAASLFVDRAGKGIRTPSRDALISFASRTEARATAFGVHRALDAVGWFGGPLIAFAILSVAPGAFDAVFFASVCAGVLGLACLAFLVVEEPPREPVVEHARVGLRAAWNDRSLRAITTTVALLGAASAGELMLVSALERRGFVEPERVPLCFTTLALVQLVASVPCARVADRFGRKRTWIGGHAALAAAYAMLWAPLASGSGFATAIACLLLVGLYLAATDGVIGAIVSVSTPVERRAESLAVVACASGIAKGVASYAFGALWKARGLELAAAVFTAVLAAGMLVAAMTRWNEREDARGA